MSLNWRQRQKQELRQQIYETALDLFASQSYEAVTVQQITERLGLAKGTFFNHFPGKEHVVAQWYNTITEQSLAAAQQRISSSAEAAVCALFADLARQATGVPELLIAKSRYNTDPLLMEVERNQVKQIKAFINEQCVNAIARGELGENVEVDPFCDLLVAVLTGTSRAWVYTQPRFDFPAVIRQRIAFLFQAIRAQS